MMRSFEIAIEVAKLCSMGSAISYQRCTCSTVSLSWSYRRVLLHVSDRGISHSMVCRSCAEESCGLQAKAKSAKCPKLGLSRIVDVDR